jgi:hypothetical protein
MKRGDLVTLRSKHADFKGADGWDEAINDYVWVPNGSIGMCWEPEQVPNGKVCVLVHGRVLWFDPLFSVNIDETG